MYIEWHDTHWEGRCRKTTRMMLSTHTRLRYTALRPFCCHQFILKHAHKHLHACNYPLSQIKPNQIWSNRIESNLICLTRLDTCLVSSRIYPILHCMILYYIWIYSSNVPKSNLFNVSNPIHPIYQIHPHTCTDIHLYTTHAHRSTTFLQDASTNDVSWCRHPTSWFYPAQT